MLVKSQFWEGAQPSAHSLFQKLNFGNNSQKTRKRRCQTFCVLSSFTGLFYFVPNTLPEILGQMEKYFSRKNVANFQIKYFGKSCHNFDQVKNLIFLEKISNIL